MSVSPQMLGLAGHDRRLSGVELAIVEVEGVLVGPQPLLRDGLQHLDLTRSSGRADVLDLAGTAPIECTIWTAVAPLAVFTVRT